MYTYIYIYKISKDTLKFLIDGFWSLEMHSVLSTFEKILSVCMYLYEKILGPQSLKE